MPVKVLSVLEIYRLVCFSHCLGNWSVTPFSRRSNGRWGRLRLSVQGHGWDVTESGASPRQSRRPGLSDLPPSPIPGLPAACLAPHWPLASRGSHRAVSPECPVSRPSTSSARGVRSTSARAQARPPAATLTRWPGTAIAMAEARRSGPGKGGQGCLCLFRLEMPHEWGQEGGGDPGASRWGTSRS